MSRFFAEKCPQEAFPAHVKKQALFQSKRGDRMDEGAMVMKRYFAVISMLSPITLPH
jgi:hypothetical protein